jgi:pimeloyl-ACP methyl ester carboxylesterase
VPELELRNCHGERLDHVFTSGGGGEPLVLIAHGVTSSHDRPYLVALSEALASAGIDSLRISFAGNGASEGRFEECTLTKEVEDLGCVLDALEGRRVAFAGHSMGAAVGVLRAADDRRIRALVSLAGMVRVRAFVECHFGDLVPGHDHMLGRERCPYSQVFLDDARAVDTVLPAARRVAVPWLLVHGTADDLVPLEDSLEARAASGGPAELVELRGVDHRFAGAHEKLVGAVVPWLARRLRG